MQHGNMPDITQAQVLSAIQWIVANLIAYGWLNQGSGQIALSAASSALAFGWIIADAFLRGKRNEHAAVLAAANMDLNSGGQEAHSPPGA